MRKSGLKEKKLETLIGLGKEIKDLQGALRLLEWDQETYMPEEAFAARSKQIAALAGVVYQKETAAKLFNLVEDLSTAFDPEKEEKEFLLLKRWQRDLKKLKALSSSFVKMWAEETSLALKKWREAKEKDQFSIFAPHLKKLIDMSKEKAALWGFKKPYDALLDEYEPDLTTEDVAGLFSSLKGPLLDILQKSAPYEEPASVCKGSWEEKRALKFCEQILSKMGLNPLKGRLDISTHPFCTSFHPTDVRVTTRVRDNLFDSIAATVHEGGHALYDAALPLDWYGTPLCEPASFGIHESQSRFWEVFIGLSRPFWEYMYPLLQKNFPQHFENISLDTFYHSLIAVKPGLTRVEADEVTYPFHVILRFEIEKALFENQISVEDIPSMWNEKMEELVGIRPSSDKEGCLQDIHWSFGGFGYFPSYTLGNIYAAMLFNTFEEEHSDWKEHVASGELLFIKNWLKKKIHVWGRQYTPRELLFKATGKELSTAPYLKHLEKRYTKT